MVEVIGGSGPAVLLLPGGAEAVSGFFPGLIEELTADPGYRIILFDRPGNGPSDARDGLRIAASALHEAIAEAGTGPVIAVGQSLGGAAALLLASQHPDDVAGLVLLDPTPINDPDLAAKVASRARMSVTLFEAPVIGRLLRGALRRSARRSADRHGMDAAARAAMLAMTDLMRANSGARSPGSKPSPATSTSPGCRASRQSWSRPTARRAIRSVAPTALSPRRWVPGW
ncbi:alpha/beta fold hydrolase [Microbacterium sp. NPDC090225]|uniref:alpha/beta fold hydrolase n=1 Tax=Microbacterium sp. NPDC090225 TaxID=3364207 RepID=UPI003810D8BD